MIDSIYLALNEKREHVHAQETQSIGLIHQKMTNRYKVVKILPKRAETLDDVFEYADAYGTIRFGYFGGRFEEDTTRDSFAAAAGGVLGIRTAGYEGFRLNVATYVSQDIPFLYDTKKRSNEFYTAEGDSYAYLAEADVEYSSDRFEAKVGRFAVDMPYANMDDIRMSRNTFEGAWGAVHFSKRWSSQFFYLGRWAGFDSADENSSQNEFKKLVEDGYGMVGASLSYKYDEESEASVWLHRIDKTADILYGEINGVYSANKAWHCDYGLQAAHIVQRDGSGVEGDVYGAMVIVHHDDLFFGVASNMARVDGNTSVTDGFGGGPYFTSLDEATIAYVSELAPGVDIDTYRFSAGYDKKEWHSSFEYAYGYMSANDIFIKENDLIYTYDKDEKWQVQVVGANFRLKSSSNNFNRVVARVDYNF